VERLKITVTIKLDFAHKGIDESKEYSLTGVMEDTSPAINEARVELLTDSLRETALEKLREQGLVPPLKKVANL